MGSGKPERLVNYDRLADAAPAISGTIPGVTSSAKPLNTPRQVLFASLIGTTIEFFDFYIYATAAVLVFPRLFFPPSDPNTATLASLATFAIAFVARPIGSVVFGHFGDRVGRKTTLVAALLTMGVSTVMIGILPTYETIGIAAPLLLALCRFGQGLGLGGEWGGAVLLATENAPPGKRAWYGMFPQLGAPIGFVFSGSVFLLLSRFLTDEQFFQFGWRIPFLASASLVAVGLYVRLTITETPIFADALKKEDARVKVPALAVFRDHPGALLLGTMISIVAYALFYMMSVFSLSWGTVGARLLAQRVPGDAAVRDPVLRGDDSDRRHHGRERPPPRHDLDDASAAIAYGFVMPTLFDGRHRGRGDDVVPGLWADRPCLRAAWDGALGTVSDGGALYRQLDRVQRRGHFRRLAGAVCGHVAGPAITACSTSATTFRLWRRCR